MQCKSYSHFFSKKFQHICVSLDVNFNELLTNDIVSFEQLGPGLIQLILELIFDTQVQSFVLCKPCPSSIVDLEVKVTDLEFFHSFMLKFLKIYISKMPQ